MRFTEEQGRIGPSGIPPCFSGKTRVLISGVQIRVLTLSTGSDMVCDGIIRGIHRGTSLAGEIDSQLFPSRRALVHKTQISLGQYVGFGCVLFEKEAHRRSLQEKKKLGCWKQLHSHKFYDILLGQDA